MTRFQGHVVIAMLFAVLAMQGVILVKCPRTLPPTKKRKKQ
jgi:hypothetical protein